MRRKPKKRDETEEISLVDTQEYLVAKAGDDRPDEPETEVISDETAEFEAFPDAETQVSDEIGEFDEPEVEDEYFEDDDYYEEPLDQVPIDRIPIDVESEPVGDEEAPEPVLDRMKIAWASLIADARKVKLPGGDSDGKVAKAGKPGSPVGVEEGTPVEEEPSAEADASGFSIGRVGAVAAILVVSLLIGVAAFLIGKGSGEDVTAAKLEGQAAGKKAGAIEGAAKGYPAGFQKGREAGFQKAYVNAYKINYKRAFEQAGQDAPADKDIDVPDP